MNEWTKEGDEVWIGWDERGRMRGPYCEIPKSPPNGVIYWVKFRAEEVHPAV